jgi:hypothetical protein
LFRAFKKPRPVTLPPRALAPTTSYFFATHPLFPLPRHLLARLIAIYRIHPVLLMVFVVMQAAAIDSPALGLSSKRTNIDLGVH